MASKILYLLMNWKAFNYLLALEQVRGAIKTLQTKMMVLFVKIVGNVSLKMSTFLAKTLILDDWLCP